MGTAAVIMDKKLGKTADDRSIAHCQTGTGSILYLRIRIGNQNKIEARERYRVMYLLKCAYSSSLQDLGFNGERTFCWWHP
jgi:hypothetical protein